MDNKSLAEIIKKIPILKFKYVGSFPADDIPQLMNNTFAIVNTDPSYKEGTHWIMLANINDTIFYYANNEINFSVSKNDLTKEEKKHFKIILRVFKDYNDFFSNLPDNIKIIIFEENKQFKVIICGKKKRLFYYRFITDKNGKVVGRY